ncbi:inverse autotransporter beta domain-containing protein, partial [Serratia sp. M24T3]|uniref:inverse autotransporter beta domain-containing protein n=1 Tax=Serratia sp. M24T3 TaxID=932213 RepID=UPI00025BBA50
MDMSNYLIYLKEIKKHSATKWVVVVIFLIISQCIVLAPVNASSNILPQLSAKDENLLNKDEGENESAAPPITRFLEQIGPSLNDETLSQHLSSKAVGLVNSQTSRQLEQLLSFSNSKARVSLNSGLDGKSRFELKLDYFNPWLEGDKYTLYSQLSSYRWNERNQFNIGIGYRYNINEGLILGSNIFFDQDLTRSHNRVGLGVEAWGERIRSSLNYYLPLSGWKKSNDAQFNPDPVHQALFERAARGWDVNLEALIFKPLSAKMTWFQWYGSEVDALGTLDRVSNNPFGLTLGLNWQPIPLLGFAIEETLLSDRFHEFKVAMNFTWNFNESMQQQLDFERGQAISALSLSRHDFVTRNNNIVLEYKKKEIIRPLYFSPDHLTVKAGSARIVNPVKGGYGGVMQYTSELENIVQVELNSGYLTPLKRGETKIRAQEFQQGWWQTPVNHAFYKVTVLPGDIPPTATQIAITGSVEVGETLTANYLFVTNEGNDEIETGSPVVWFYENDPTTPLSQNLHYKLRAEDRGHTIIFQVTPMNKDKLSGNPVKYSVKVPGLSLNDLLIARDNTRFGNDETIVFPQASTGQLRMSATVKDSHNKPVANVPVYWHQINSALGSIINHEGLTDGNGKAIIRYEGITAPGKDTITASLQPYVANMPSSSISLENSLSRNIRIEFSAGIIESLPALTLNVGDSKTIIPKGGIVGEKYQFSSENADIVAIDQGQLNAKKVGVTEIIVSQNPTATVNAPTPVRFAVSVSRRLSAELYANPVIVEFGAEKQRLVIDGGNGGELSYRSLDEKVVSVSAKGEMRFVGAGNTNIAVSQAATATEDAPAEVTVAVTVKKVAGNALQVKALALKIDGVRPIEVTGGNVRAFSYRSNDEKI